MTLFTAGDRVAIIPHRSHLPDGTIERLATVVDPHRPTDMRRITGQPVGHYVAVRPADSPREELYHEASLQVVNRQVPP